MLMDGKEERLRKFFRGGEFFFLVIFSSNFFPSHDSEFLSPSPAPPNPQATRFSRSPYARTSAAILSDNS